MYIFHNMKKLEPVFLWIVKIGLFLIPFLPLYIATSMLFPFITGKNFAFRIITEILFIFWIWLAAANPDYRPKLTPLFKAVTLFIGIVFLADIFGPNPYRSLFSNFERMEGFMMLGHLYLYYVMLSSVFRRNDWMIFFHSTLLASLCVSYIGLLQKLGLHVSIQGGFRVDSTIGNPTYLAAYLLFHLWILLILMYTYRKQWWALLLYACAFFFEIMIVYFTATRGAMMGIVAAGLFLAGAVLWKWPSIFPPASGKPHQISWPLGRKISAIILALFIIIPFLFWLARGSQFVQSNQILRRVTNYSFQEGTIQARFHIWGQSWKGFLDRPILGWGQEYYNPALWSDEPWFDRSHNIFFDWLIHAGILGLGAYLSIYAVLYAGIIRAIKKNKALMWYGIIIVTALGAHIIQNIFVFDNLNTYLLFFAFLAFGSFLMTRQDTQDNRKSRRIPDQAYSRASIIAVISGIAIASCFSYLHLTPISQSKALIQALTLYQQQGTMDQLSDAFNHALSYNSFGTTEVREQLVNISGSVAGNQRYSNAEQTKFITLAIDELRKQIATPAKDVKHMMFLGSLLNQIMSTNPAYVMEAKNVLEEAVKISPTKQILSFELAQHDVMTRQDDAARDVLYRAWKFDPSFHTAGIHTWVLAIITGRNDIASEVRTQFPLTALSEEDLFRLGSAYRKMQNYKEALGMYDQLVIVAPDNAKYRATYAALLAHAGKIVEARVQAKEAIRIDPKFANEANNFLENLDIQ